MSELCRVQIVKKNNAKWVISESLLDHIWTNTPISVLKGGQEKKRASDHQLVWLERSAKNLVEKVKRVEKRSMKTFRLEALVELCRQEDWIFRGGEEQSKQMLEERVEAPEKKTNTSWKRWPPCMLRSWHTEGSLVG